MILGRAHFFLIAPDARLLAFEQAVQEMYDTIRIRGHVRFVRNHDDRNALVTIKRS